MNEVQGDGRKTRLAEALAKLKAQGKTPQEIGRERAVFALRWLHRWGFSSPQIIDDLKGTKQRGLCAKLERFGLVRTAKTEAGMLGDLPRKIVVLTEQGLAEAERHCGNAEYLLNPLLDPHRVNQAQLRHDLMVQKATTLSLLAGQIHDFLTPRELAKRSEADIKQPDGVWTYEDDTTWPTLVELELTGKWGRKFDEFAERIAAAMTEMRYGKILILSDSLALLRRYHEGLKSGKEFNVWKPDCRGRFSVDRTKKVILPDSDCWGVPPLQYALFDGTKFSQPSLD